MYIFFAIESCDLNWTVEVCATNVFKITLQQFGIFIINIALLLGKKIKFAALHNLNLRNKKNNCSFIKLAYC